MSRIKFKPRRITIAGQVPTIDQLENGEFAINTADQKIFQRVGSSVVEVSNVGVVQGTTNEIEVSTVGSTSTIGLPNDVTITGDLTVNGTTTTISTTNTVISDNLLELNSGASSNANDSGIIIERGSTGDNAIIFWDESADVFRLATTTATAASTGNLSTTDANLNVGGLTTSGNIVIPDAGTIGSASATSAMTVASTGIVTFVDDIIIKDGGTIGAASATGAITISSGGIVTLVDDLIIKDGGTIGSASDVDAIAIGSDGDVTLTQDLELQHDGAILSFGANDEITLTHVHDTGLLLADSGGTPTLQFHDSNESVSSDGGHLIFTSNGVAFDFPSADGSNGQVLKTNGGGVLSFTDVTASSLAADDLAAGDAAVTLTTSSGNITIDAAANDSDIILKGTDGGADTTFLTIDGSDAGTAIFNHDIKIADDGQIGSASAADAMIISSGGIVTFKDDILIKDGGTIGAASATSAITISSGGVVTLVDDLVIKDGGTIGVASDADSITIASDGAVTLTQALAGTSADFDGGVTIDNITIDGTEIDLSSGDLTLDVAGDIVLDAAGEEVIFKDGSTNVGHVSLDSDNLTIKTLVGDKDFIIKGVDDSSEITALTLDMSAAGAATFNNDVTAFSDERLKTEIETINDALNKVCQMRGVSFKRTDNDGRTSVGVIAQEIEKILPEVVREDKSEDKIKSVAYGNIVGVLIEAIKELKNEIEELKKG